MSQLDALLARSQSPSDFVERKHFTLSREKAIEKQREFALRHPNQYVLELVQAAVFAGATYMAIDTRPNSLLVAWVGAEPIPKDQLESLFDYLFADRGDMAIRHMVQLAVGVNAIMQRNPKVLRIETGDGVTATRMDISPDGQVDLGVVNDAIAGTYLYAEFNTGWLHRFTASKQTPERSLVESKCLYTPVPILLNGDAPFGYRGSKHVEIFGARVQETFQDESGRHGVVAIHQSDRAPTGFRMVIGGVWVTTLPLAELHRNNPLVGVVCDNMLRKTADQSDIVQDDRYVRMLHCVEPHATKVIRSLDSAYAPPKLPAIPEAASVNVPNEPIINPEPIGDSIPAIAPWRRVQVSTFKRVPDKQATFFITPEGAKSLKETDILRFPYRILVMTEGQALTFGSMFPVTLHRMTSAADLEFVRRILDRQEQIIEASVPGDGIELTLRLHQEGQMPDWADGQPGIPYVINSSKGTLDHGALTSAGRFSAREGRSSWPEVEATKALTLPRISVIVHAEEISDKPIWPTLLNHVWRLAVEDGTPDGQLLARLLGMVAVPRFHEVNEQIVVDADLPLDWPKNLRTIPLIQSAEGPVSFDTFLGLLGTHEVVHVKPQALVAMGLLEERFGSGHIVTENLQRRPVIGVGRVGNRWLPLEKKAHWSQLNMSQVIWVASTFSPLQEGDKWVPVPPKTNNPSIVASTHQGVQAADWDAGYTALTRLIEKRIAELAFAGLNLPAHHAAHMMRVALADLADPGMPIFAPSDAGSSLSLSQLQKQPLNTKILARNGVDIAEPMTFALSMDELAVLQRANVTVKLRYDDDPEVWRSLADGKNTGWLIRHEIRHAGVRGWLGLRVPFDPTGGVLLRASSKLSALGRGSSVACHGLVWSQKGDGLSNDQQGLIQLESLRLYQQLQPILSSKDKAKAEAARLYAFTFVQHQFARTGKLSGTAEALARQVEVFDERGHPWGPMSDWLGKDPSQRPAPPKEVIAPTLKQTTQAIQQIGSPLDHLAGRLKRALRTRADVVIVARPDTGALARVDDRRSTAAKVVVLLDSKRPLVSAVLAGGADAQRATELLAMSIFGHLTRFLNDVDATVSPANAQQVLVAQRL